MLSKLIEVAKTAFVSAEDRERIVKTKGDHETASSVFNRTLEEVTEKYKIENVYTMTEQLKDDIVQKYIFEEAPRDLIGKCKEFYNRNEGLLVLVDEIHKHTVNQKFHFEYNSMDFNRFNDVAIQKAPDFIFEIEGDQYWVSLEPIRTNKSEEQHTKDLELLFKAFSQTKDIDIDPVFDRYGNSRFEKWHDLIYFRTNRNSIYIVIKDRENGEIKSHQFEKIHSINFMDTDDRIKVWLYMSKGPYRFYLPYKQASSLQSGDFPVDPAIYPLT